MRDQYLRSLLPQGDQAIAVQLEKHVIKPMLAILTTYMETRLKRQFVQLEDTVTYFDKIVMFSDRENQIDILKFIQL